MAFYNQSKVVIHLKIHLSMYDYRLKYFPIDLNSPYRDELNILHIDIAIDDIDVTSV